MNIYIPCGVYHTQEVVVNGRGMPYKNRQGFGNLILKVHVVTQDAEQRVLEEKSVSLKEIFSYIEKTPVVGSSDWTARATT
jgi:DnaJ-class molecular chaperone